jgi:hypothetical protein
MQGDRLWSILSTEPIIEHPQDCDVNTLWAQYFNRQRLLGQIVTGQMNPDDLLDALLDDELSPDDYLEEVDAALEPFVGD